jgi:DivIVA domain-containing protein
MGTVELDRQVIERRDFPIVRRGYDPASVDAHLRALAADVDELRHEAQSRGGDSLGAVAGTQVQGILEAAQATAETIEREAAQGAQATRAAADADARRIRDEAIARAQERVAAVSQATEVLLARVATMDGETQTLVESLRTGAGQLARDLAEVEGNMSVLYDSAAGRTEGGGNAQSVELGAEPKPKVHYIAADDTAVVAPPAEPHEAPFVEPPGDSHEGMQGDPFTEQPHVEPATADSSEDLDGARLVALNMALNGDSRDETGQYLAENFAVSDRERLLDEVYAAIEG